MKNFANWWTSLTFSESAALLIGAFLAIFLLTMLFAWWADPLKVEVRQIQRKRRRERRLIAQTRALLLKRHDSMADRDCYRMPR